ncbi:MAG: MG2 domain-containing protein, partial [Acidobacteriota bacterium]|nr:MG2 domain-containing protein [Acidobacteriota bacterium]
MKQFISSILIAAIFLGLISPFAVKAQRICGGVNQSNMNSSTEKGLKFRLSEGAEAAENRRITAPAKGDALSENETSNLLKRLPAVKAEADDKTDFAKRQGSLPAPKTGKLVPVKFPATEQRNLPNVNSSNTLEVVRFSPEGAVSLAPDLNVTFSQPMVAVSSQEDAAKNVPVKLSPTPEGNWRWLGTKTLMFDAAKRFPMATRFTAGIPAGTKSANGQILQKDVVWTFQTPPPTVETKIPENQTTRRDAIIFVSFDQEINRDAVIKTVSVTSGKQKISVRLASEEEIAKDETVSYYIKNVQPKRFLAFRAVNADGSTENALPADAPITVTIEKGTPSAEGELTTIKAQSFSFKTYGAMRFVKKYCGWNERKTTCAPSDEWRLEFTNQIDETTFDKSRVKIEPNVPDLKIYPQGNSIVIDGAKPPRKSFKVTVDGALKDQFGQTPGQNITANFNVGAAEDSFNGAGGNLVVLDPFAAPVYSIYSTNHAAARVKIYQVQPTDWNGFAQYLRLVGYDERKRLAMPGKLVSDTVLKIKNTPDEFVETPVDLRGFLNDGLGNLILDVEAVEDLSKAVTVRGSASRKVVWIQSTKIGLDAFVDNRELVALATDLRTGKPLSGVDLTIAPNGKAVGGQASAVSSEDETAGVESNQNWSEWLRSWFAAPSENLKGASVEDETGAAALLETIGETQTNSTAANGIARLALPDSQAKEQNILIARRGNDAAFLPENTEYYYRESGSWFKKPDADGLRWFVFDDRKMYRPKEEVSIKGYVRRITGGKFGDVAPLVDAAGGLTYSVKDSRDNEIGKGTANLNAFGAFDFKFVLPDNANLGYSRIEFTTASGLENSKYSHQFQIQEFRRPEFEVKAQNETAAPYFVKSSALVSVTANYFAGGDLANAETNWTVTSSPTNYTPPNRDDFTFGKWFPWWRSYGGDYGETTRQNFKGVTDAIGKHVLKIDFEAANPARPYKVSANASVQDVNRQTWASSTNLLVHPSELYVGIRTQKTFVQPNEAFDVESIVTDIDGKLIANRTVEIRAVLKDWTFEKGEWTEKIVEEQTCSVQSGEGAQKCTFTPKRGGNYTITARVLDDRERPNESELTVWVAGAKSEPKRAVEQEDAQLIPNKKDYAPGDVAEILVQSPFENAEGVLTLRRDGIVKTERFTMRGSSTVLRIALEEKYLPNVRVQVDLVGAAERETGSAGILPALSAEARKQPKLNQTSNSTETFIRAEALNAGRMPALRPAFASGEINLPISTRTRSLTVSAEPRAKSLEPGGATKIDVAVKDNLGNAVADSEVALVVVDESILALTNYQMPNPLDVFYTEREANVMDYHSRANVLLANPNKGFGTGQGDGIGDGQGSGRGSGSQVIAYAAPSATSKLRLSRGVLSGDASQVEAEDQAGIELRTNFSPLAIFAPSVKTDADGRTVVDIKLPDNLTRYRVMVVAVDGRKRFGKSESNLTAKQPLMVRPSAPRFMNFGDKIELPVVVQNQTDNEMIVDVAVRSSNAELTNGGGRRVTIAANDRAEIRFPVSATKAGTARFQFAATSGKFADAAEIELPVWTPATSEAFATYGTTDENGAIVQPIEAPRDVFEQFGGLEITTSSTQLQELTDAFIYLQNYPFECSEQIASRMISVAALQEV